MTTDREDIRATVPLKDVIDITYKVSDKVDRFWNVFISINLVSIGWLVAYQDNFSISEKIAVSTAYAACLVVNYRAISRQYHMLKIFMEEINYRIDQHSFYRQETNDLVKTLQFPRRGSVVNLVYFSTILVVYFLIWNV